MTADPLVEPPAGIDPALVGLFPTPLHGIPGLSATLPDSPTLLVKREDLSGLGLGGNKARKLRALLTEARQLQATVALVSGGPQSNCCAQLALAAKMTGLRAELILRGDDPGERRGNLLVAALADARLHFVGTDGDVDATVQRRARELSNDGERPYVIPLGASTALGAAACVGIVEEIVSQANEAPPTHIVIAAGSLGTIAGIIIGSWVYRLDCEIHGYSVLWPAAEASERLEALLKTTRQRYFPDVQARSNYRLFGDQLGDGYGAPTVAGRTAISTLAGSDGLLLDNTYTAKAMAGLISGVNDGLYRPGDRVVFVHTGGAGGLLATSAAM